MLNLSCSRLLALVLICVEPTIQKTTSMNWLTVPNQCLNPWLTQSDGLKRSSDFIINWALLGQEPYQSYTGIICDEGDGDSCEGIWPSNEPNLCWREFNSEHSQIMVKQEDSVIVEKELFLFHENGWKFQGASVSSFSFDVPVSALDGPLGSVKFRNGIVSCSFRIKTCQFLGKDYTDWETFPTLLYDHYRGSLNNVGGKLVTIGGMDVNSIPHVKMEMFDGVEWISLPDLDLPRRGFATVVINRTSLVLIGGVNQDSASLNGAGSDFLMYHVDTGQWVSLPPYPYKQIYLTCCNFNNDGVQGILCLGGSGPSNFTLASNRVMLFDWNTQMWSHAPQYDVLSQYQGYEMGSIVQFKNSLYYVPFFDNVAYEYSQIVFRLDLNATIMTWEDLGLTLPITHEFPLVYQMDLFTIG